jgi:5'-3' exonuclease
VCYRSAASCEPTKVKHEREALEFAIARADECIRRILYATNAGSYKLFIGGGGNFRHDIDPNYKANRKDKPRPEYLQAVREFVVTEWNAMVADGIEADDMLGIEQCADNLEDTIICSIDKDLLQIPGNHFNFVKEETYLISPREGWANFYTQLIMGDKSDNVMGFDGKMRQTIPKFLQPYIDEIHSAKDQASMYQIVKGIYELDDDAMLRNAKLLYIWRQEQDEFCFPEI